MFWPSSSREAHAPVRSAGVEGVLAPHSQCWYRAAYAELCTVGWNVYGNVPSQCVLTEYMLHTEYRVLVSLTLTMLGDFHGHEGPSLYTFV